jgi:hypothetical protein
MTEGISTCMIAAKSCLLHAGVLSPALVAAHEAHQVSSEAANRIVSYWLMCGTSLDC